MRTAEKQFESFLEKLKTKIFIIKLPEKVFVINKDVNNYYGRHPPSPPPTEQSIVEVSIIEEVIEEYIEEVIIVPDPYEEDLKWFFERFANLTVDELKSLTSVYIHRKPPKRRKIIIPPPPPPKPESPKEKEQIFTRVIDGDYFSIKPAALEVKKYSISGKVKYNYKSYWMQIVQKLTSEDKQVILIDFKDELGYYKCFEWHAKKKALLKSA